jgi:hypothetical protein
MKTMTIMETAPQDPNDQIVLDPNKYGVNLPSSVVEAIDLAIVDLPIEIGYRAGKTMAALYEMGKLAHAQQESAWRSQHHGDEPQEHRRNTEQ